MNSLREGLAHVRHKKDWKRKWRVADPRHKKVEKQNKAVESEKDLIKVMEEKFAELKITQTIEKGRNDKEETATKEFHSIIV